MTRFAADINYLFGEVAFIHRFQATRDAGFDAVQFSWPSAEDLGGLPLSAVVEKVKSTGVQVSIVGLESHGEPALATGAGSTEAFLGRVDEVLAFCQAVGSIKVAVSIWTAEGIENPDEAAARIAAGADRVFDSGVTLALRPGGVQRGVPGVATRSVLEMVRRVYRPNVVALTDPSVAAAVGEDPVVSAQFTMGYIGHVEIADFPGGAQPGTGTIAWKDLFQALATSGYADPVGLRFAPTSAGWSQYLADLGGNQVSDKDRLARTQAALAARGLDALVLVLGENVLAFSGYWPMNGTCVAVIPRNGEPTLIVPRGEETWSGISGWSRIRVYPTGRLADPGEIDATAPILAAVRSEQGLARVGVERDMPFPAPSQMAHLPAALSAGHRRLLEETFGTECLIPVDDLILRARAVKTARELAMVRRTNAVADVGFAAFRDGLRPGNKDSDVAASIDRAIQSFGVGHAAATRARSYAYVMSGPQTAQCYLSYEISSPRVMQEGDAVLLELAVVVDGYWADLSRTHVVGKAAALQVEAHAAAEAARKAGLAAAVPGATGGDVDRAARDAVAAAGFGTNYPHGTGHGVGFNFHEPYPYLKPNQTDVIEEGMVIAVEPGVYLPGIGGFRNEDDAIVTAKGAVPMGTASWKLEVT